MADLNLGANEFTFAGDRTQITYHPVAPGPVVQGQEGGIVQYQGVEGSLTFRGPEIENVSSPLGVLLSVVLRPQGDAGGITVTLLVPHVTGVTRQHPVTFETLAIKATSRGFIATPGADHTYTIVPLLATAKAVLLPFDQQVPGASGTSPPS
jgi:hypothetical protein